MTECERRGHHGTVGADGICDTCLRPAQPGTVPGRPENPESESASGTPGPPGPAEQRETEDPQHETREAGGSWWGLNLASLPSTSPVSLDAVVKADLTVPVEKRTCQHCGSAVGRGHDEGEALAEGFCPRCGKRYSLKPRLAPGETVGKYLIKGCIGYGGVGWVFLAEDTHLHGQYAVLKGLINPRDERAADAAARELDFLLEVDHPNVVRVKDFVSVPSGEDGEDARYIVMDYVRGHTLGDLAAQYQDQRGGMPAEHAIAYCLQLLAALDHLHGRGWLHCDITPRNVMVAGTEVKVIDLGAGCPQGTTGHHWGVPGFRAPEVRKHGCPTIRSDLYSAGKTLDTLFRWSPQDDQAGPAAESLRLLINRAIADRPEERFRDAEEMASQLSGVLREYVAARTGAPVPARASMFGPETIGLPPGDLARIPPLSWWTRDDAFRSAASGAGRPLTGLLPDPVDAAARLPAPRPDPRDPAADLVLSLSAADPDSAIEQVNGAESPEASLLVCRAELALRQLPAAKDACDRAEARCREGDWRIGWHRALVRLAEGHWQDAFSGFMGTYQALPGEIVPKLGLGLCAEYLNEFADAERRFSTVWRTDQSYVAAAFGLARTRIRAGDRAGAVKAVDEVPGTSRHARAAEIAAFRLLTGFFPRCVDPSGDDLEDAERRLREHPGLRPDSQEERQGPLWVLLTEARIGCAGGIRGKRGPGFAALRSDLEDGYLSLARRASDDDQHAVLMDLANEARNWSLD